VYVAAAHMRLPYNSNPTSTALYGTTLFCQKSETINLARPALFILNSTRVSPLLAILYVRGFLVTYQIKVCCLFLSVRARTSVQRDVQQLVVPLAGLVYCSKLALTAERSPQTWTGASAQLACGRVCE
jgi:hypothetical protein